MSAVTIGQVAKQAGVGIDTVRYYERAGLLPAAPRSSGGSYVGSLMSLKMRKKMN